MDCDESATRTVMGSVADKVHAGIFKRTHATHLERDVNFEVAFASEAESTAIEHLLQHYRKKRLQEDLCFALWRPSTGQSRRAALIDEIILPRNNERSLHGGASFEPSYLSRALRMAALRKAGLAFMHSHPSSGWQNMSPLDIEAERDVLAYPACATGLPLVGLTVGNDGYWSARFWEKDNGEMHRHWCEKVRIAELERCRFHFNDFILRPPQRKEILKRTFDTWGREAQETISRLRFGIVGLGSVGCIVAEALSRIGATRVTLIDYDEVKEHNLDRLLYGTRNDIGKRKVDLAAKSMRRNATSEHIEITSIPTSIREEFAYRNALDCDVLLCCVDRPVARDVLNYIAHAHLIPVIDGGIAIEVDPRNGSLHSAHWRTHLVTPYHRCMRCNGQYDSSMVVMELDGSSDDPSYVSNLPDEARSGNQNVFPFALSAAAMQINLTLRHLLSADWWPSVRQQDYQFVTGTVRIINEDCHPNCSFRKRRALGDAEKPPYLLRDTRHERTFSRKWPFNIFDRIRRKF